MKFEDALESILDASDFTNDQKISVFDALSKVYPKMKDHIWNNGFRAGRAQGIEESVIAVKDCRSGTINGLKKY